MKTHKKKKPADLSKLAKTQTFGRFLAGVPMWPREEVDRFALYRSKRVADLEEEQAAELHSITCMAALLVEQDGNVEGAARLRALIPLLRRQGNVRSLGAKVESGDLDIAKLYRTARELCRDAKRAKLRARDMRELGDILEHWIGNPRAFNTLTL